MIFIVWLWKKAKISAAFSNNTRLKKRERGMRKANSYGSWKNEIKENKVDILILWVWMKEMRMRWLMSCTMILLFVALSSQVNFFFALFCHVNTTRRLSFNHHATCISLTNIFSARKWKPARLIDTVKEGGRVGWGYWMGSWPKFMWPQMLRR